MLTIAIDSALPLQDERWREEEAALLSWPISSNTIKVQTNLEPLMSVCIATLSRLSPQTLIFPLAHLSPPTLTLLSNFFLSSLSHPPLLSQISFIFLLLRFEGWDRLNKNKRLAGWVVDVATEKRLMWPSLPQESESQTGSLQMGSVWSRSPLVPNDEPYTGWNCISEYLTQIECN